MTQCHLGKRLWRNANAPDQGTWRRDHRRLMDLPAARWFNSVARFPRVFSGWRAAPLENVIPTKGSCFRKYRGTLQRDSSQILTGPSGSRCSRSVLRDPLFVFCTAVLLERGFLKHIFSVLPLVNLNQHLQAGALAAILHKLTGDCCKFRI